MKLKLLVEDLVRIHGTRDPIVIAEQMGIHVIYEPLGTINGYFNVLLGERFIHLNQNVDEHQQYFTAAHELGHALLHPNTNAMFLIKHTNVSVGNLENEANKFAMQLLFDDDLVEEYKEFPIPKLSEIFSVKEDLIEYRFKMN